MSTTTATQPQIEMARSFLEARSFRLTPGIEDIELGELIAQAQADAIERHGIGGNNPPAEARIDPEKLVDVATLEALLQENYGPLLGRRNDALSMAREWMEDHRVPPPPDWPAGRQFPDRALIGDEDSNDRTAEFLKVIDGLCGVRTRKGEVEDTRRLVKTPPYEACKKIDEWFATQIKDLLPIVALADAAQTEYVLAKAEKVKREQQRLANEAAARSADLAAKAKALGGETEAVMDAIEAEEQAETAQRRVETTTASQAARSVTASGVTVGVKANWKWRLVDRSQLILAAAGPMVQRLLWTIPTIAQSAELQAAIAKALHLNERAYQVPEDFVMEASSPIGAATRAATGRREIAGLEIWNDAKASRR